VTAAPADDGAQVELTVADSGPGFPTLDLEAITDDGGVGLSNTKRRLQTLYGDAQTMTLGTAPEGGALVTIRLPADPDTDVSIPEDRVVEAAAPEA
jgi:sensor histidine kinase YesM